MLRTDADDILDKGREEGIKEGRKEGIEIGDENTNNLYRFLFRNGRSNDAMRAMDDRDYRYQLLNQFQKSMLKAATT